MIKLSEFFDAFKPLNGGLSGVELARMHACLKDQDITSKPFDVFCTDVDVDDEHRVTLYSLNRYVCIHRSPRHPHLTSLSSDLAFCCCYARRWFFREVKDREPPRMPKLGDLRRLIDTTSMGTNRSLAAHKAEEEGKLRRKQSMLDRAGKRIAYEGGHDQTSAATQRAEAAMRV